LLEFCTQTKGFLYTVESLSVFVGEGLSYPIVYFGKWKTSGCLASADGSCHEIVYRDPANNALEFLESLFGSDLFV
jgi:hypothetical protein